MDRDLYEMIWTIGLNSSFNPSSEEVERAVTSIRNTFEGDN